jgi:AraC-like DNA-binding protein
MRENPEMTSDPLSDILAAFNTQSFLSGGIVAGGAWAIRFPPPKAIKFGALVRGTCWHMVEGFGEPVRLGQGDVFVVNGSHPLRLASDPAIDPVDATEAFAAAPDGTAALGAGEDVRLLGGHVALDAVGAALLSEVLPPLIHVRAETSQAGVLTWLLDRLLEETAHPRPGSSAIALPLAHLLFVHVLRDHVEHGGLETGWLRAAGDPRIAPAMSMMHAAPARNWRLAELAEAVGMSRSSFAERFKAVCGMAPLSYLTFWRMRLAEGALRDGAPSLAALSSSLGYASESAFSTAFKRVVGVSPANYRALQSL